MSPTELETAIVRHLTAYDVSYTTGSHGPEIPGVLVTIHGAVDGHPMRTDFHGPGGVDDGSYLVLMFDLRTKNEIGKGASPESFDDALANVDWPNVLGALTH
jgi:hypothetical protein